MTKVTAGWRMQAAVLGLMLSSGFLQVLPAQEPMLVAETDPLTADEQAKHFHLPPGFQIELVACEPAIQKPMNLNFDAQGRLWVTQSVEYPYPADETKQTPRDTLRILSDGNGDGVPDQVHVFADGLNIPIGVTPLVDGALCYSIPNIQRFRDTTGDGKADQREVYYGEFGHRDTHGMASSFRWWIDGWVYACHGFANDSTVKGSSGKPIVMNSGNTYRMRPDGSYIEYFTHGQVNPFGLAFDPLGNVYSADCHSKPIYMLLRGAWYPSFGKPHDGLGFGPVMIKHLHGSTGIAGVVYYAADHFPPEYQDTVFIGNPVTGRINHDRLNRHGSTYTAVELPDFLRCDDPWFRPVDIQLAPDGSLYVADFYNRIIGHYEVPLEHPGRDRERGRIWRITYRGDGGDKKPPPPDLTKLDVDPLLQILASPNLPLRVLATHQLADRIGAEAAPAIKNLLNRNNSDVWQRVHGLWVLHRLDALTDDLVRKLARDPEAAVRIHLMKALAERADWASNGLEREVALAMLGDSDAFLRRAATDALGRHPDQSDVPRLLLLWEETPSADTHLIHVARMALRDVLATREDLVSLVDEFTDRPDRQARLAEIALGLPTSQSAAYLLKFLTLRPELADRWSEYLHHARRHADDQTLEGVDRFARTLQNRPDDVQTAALLALHRAAQERSGRLPDDLRVWAVEVGRRFVTAKVQSVVDGGLRFAGELALTELADELIQAAGPNAMVRQSRPLAIDVAAGVIPERARVALIQIVASDSEPLSLRQKAAETVGYIQDDAVRQALLETLALAPSSLATSIARGLVWSDQGGDALLTSIEQGKASRLLLQDARVAHELRFREFKDKQSRMQTLLQDLPAADERIRQLIEERRKSFVAQTDIERGASVFQKNCSACHQVSGQGGKVGPQLDGVGVRGLDRILEDVLDPNRNVDQTFRSTLLSLTDGRVLSGLVLREEGAVVVLADAEGKEHRIAAETIEERRTTPLSPMPADIAEKISIEEFNLLLNFLLSQQQKPIASSGSDKLGTE